jgi:hypothetical protein
MFCIVNFVTYPGENKILEKYSKGRIGLYFLHFSTSAAGTDLRESRIL